MRVRRRTVPLPRETLQYKMLPRCHRTVGRILRTFSQFLNILFTLLFLRNYETVVSSWQNILSQCMFMM